MSLHVGVNQVDPAHYGSVTELFACEADAEDMEKIAVSVGYTPKTLRTSAATLSNMAAEIQAAAESLDAVDIFLLTYSGHGSQLPDRNDDEEDHLDETWCLFDGQLVDDTLYTMFGRFKAGVRILMLSDSCHSGTMIGEALRCARIETRRARSDQVTWAAFVLYGDPTFQLVSMQRSAPEMP